MRARLVILAAIVAALVTIGHTCGDYSRGIVSVGRTGSGTLGAYDDSIYGYPGALYESEDGGMTWTYRSELIKPFVDEDGGMSWAYRSEGIEPFVDYEFDVRDWQKLEVMDKSGAVYIVDGADIIRAWNEGEEQGLPSEAAKTSEKRDNLLGPFASRDVVYSFEHLQSRVNRWMQALEKGADESEITTQAYGLFYDDQSGNLIVAMGRQGIVVVAPDGTSTRVAVNPYDSPTDFSLRGKIDALLDPLLGRWTLQYPGIALLLALSFAALASVGPVAPPGQKFPLIMAAAISALLSVFMGVYAQSPWYEGHDRWDPVGWIVSFLSGNGWIPAVLTAILTAGGLIFARPTVRQVLLLAAVSIMMLLLIAIGALVLFEAGAIAANFAAVGMVVVAALAVYGIWMLVKHRSRSIASRSASEP